MHKGLIPLALSGLISITLGACSPKTVAADRPEGESRISTEIQDSVQNRGPITYILMSRTGCYGTCPIYSTGIHADGRVRYHGLKFTEKEGVFQKDLPQEKIRELFSRFEEYGVDSCQKEYPAYIQDLPGLHFNLVYDSRDTQRIRNAEFGPPFLKELARRVDDLAKPDFSWKKEIEP